VPRFRLIDEPAACFAWDGTAFHSSLPPGPAEGAFAGLDSPSNRLVRDPLGLGKLFWAPASGTIHLASRPAALTARGHPLAACRAFPANTAVTYAGDVPRVEPVAPLDDDGKDDASVESLADRIHDNTTRYIDAILRARPGPAVVCLSGGLDSTAIAALVREARDDAVAITFDLARQRSDDTDAAARAARHLGLSLVPAVHTPEALFDQLDAVLVAGIDWRDFNVHAGLVNAGLGLSIAALLGDQSDQATVFTGDLVNELLADYHSETYEGREYYRLPRLPLPETRDALVRGLETTHREIGVFGHYGLRVVQPYAAARPDFLRLPPEMLGTGPGKGQLYRLMFADALPRSAYDRPKTRAQVGSADSGHGVLAACIDAGYDADHLARRFAQLHGVDDPRALTGFMRGGRYRTAIPRGDHDQDPAR
jgi:asparagine synthetase B (glutamine-hydrolysing)